MPLRRGTATAGTPCPGPGRLVRRRRMRPDPRRQLFPARHARRRHRCRCHGQLDGGGRRGAEREDRSGPRPGQVRRFPLRHRGRHHFGLRRHRLRDPRQRQPGQGHQHEPGRLRHLRHHLPGRDHSAVSRGSTVVVAAGNSNQDAGGFRPANCSSVGTVAASNPGGEPVLYSDYGAPWTSRPRAATPASAAAASCSTINTGTSTPGGAGYANYQGTSMAAPHVAGLAALMKSKSPALPPPRWSPRSGRAPGDAGRLHQGLRRRPLRCHRHHGAAGRNDPAPPSGNLLLNPASRAAGVLDLRPRGHL